MSNGLTFRALRRANIARIPLFRDRHGRIVHNATGSDWSPAQWLQALIGELGEYANVQKKVERGDLTPEEAAPMIRDELADVMCYLDILALQVGVDLGEAVVKKFNEVSIRVGAPVFFNIEADVETGTWSKP